MSVTATRRCRPFATAPLTLCAAGLVLLLLPVPAAANMGVPWDVGEPTGEPAALRDVAITHEELVLDLRPIESLGPAQVSVTYRIRNDADAVAANLVFVSPGLSEGSVTLDGSELPAEPLPSGAPLPATWQAPATVPGIDGRAVEYRVTRPEAIAFPATIPSGEHEFVVRYDAQPSAYHLGHNRTRDYQIAYVLAPARTWRSFGTLDVRVDLPPGWAAAASLPLVRTGDTLTGSFEGVPADSLGITIRPPQPPLVPLGLLALAGGTLGTGYIGFRTGRRARRRGWRTWRVLAVTAVLALAGALLLAVAATAAMATEQTLATGYHASRVYTYSSGLFILGTGLVGSVLGLAAGPVGLAIGLNRGGRRAPAFELRNVGEDTAP